MSMMFEKALAAPKVKYTIDDNRIVIVDVIELAWLFDEWSEAVETDETINDKNRVVAEKVSEYLNGLENLAETPLPWTASDAAALLMGLPEDVEAVKKKLCGPPNLSRSTDTTSFPQDHGSSSTFGSSPIRSEPFERSDTERPTPSVQATDSAI